MLIITEEELQFLLSVISIDKWMEMSDKFGNMRFSFSQLKRIIVASCIEELLQQHNGSVRALAKATGLGHNTIYCMLEAARSRNAENRTKSSRGNDKK